MVKKHVIGRCKKESAEKESELRYCVYAAHGCPHNTWLFSVVQHFPISLKPRFVHLANANTLGQQHINVAKVTASESPPDCRFGTFQRRRRQCGVVPTTPLCTSALDDGVTMMTRRCITLHPSPVSRRYMESRRLLVMPAMIPTTPDLLAMCRLADASPGVR